MKKELLWAIITGFGLGLIITWGLWSAKKAVQPTKPEPVVVQTTPSPVLPSISLVINEPEQESIVEKDSVVLSGLTDPQAILAIFTAEDELILEADEKGNFKTEVNLIEGANEITVVAFDDEGNEASKSMTLVYSTAEL